MRDTLNWKGVSWMHRRRVESVRDEMRVRIGGKEGKKKTETATNRPRGKHRDWQAKSLSHTERARVTETEMRTHAQNHT
eukprot:5187386-Pleurochrysis_carterae.AAC.1